MVVLWCILVWTLLTLTRHVYSSGMLKGSPLSAATFDHPIQSPVDIITNRSVHMNLPSLEVVEGEQDNVQATLVNSGHTAVIYIDEDPSKKPYIKGGPLTDTFIFQQVHFHWGTGDSWGSEHFLDGEGHTAEVHVVHFNSKYADFNNAVKERDGLVVLAVFVEANNSTNTLLDPVISQFDDISQPNSSVRLDSMEALRWPYSALSANHEYYSYLGSLTTEPFTENVIWVILPKEITLSHDQLHKFRMLHSDGKGGFILDNKRGLQPLYRRPVVRSCTEGGEDNNAEAATKLKSQGSFCYQIFVFLLAIIIFRDKL